MRADAAASRSALLWACALLSYACTAPRPPAATTEAPPPSTAAAAAANDGNLVSAATASQPGMTCRQSVATARGALLRLGYEVTDTQVPEAGRPGKLLAVKHTGWMTGQAGTDYHAAVILRCDNSGAELELLSDESLLGRLALRREFSDLVAEVAARRVRRPRATNTPPANDRLAIAVEPLRDGGRAAFGADLAAVGITPVHVVIRNGSNRTYTFQAERLQMITQERERHSALPAAEVAARVPAPTQAAVSAQALGDATIEAGAAIDGYLFFPASTYQRANAVLIDTESEEAEGFSIQF